MVIESGGSIDGDVCHCVRLPSLSHAPLTYRRLPLQPQIASPTNNIAPRHQTHHAAPHHYHHELTPSPIIPSILSYTYFPNENFLPPEPHPPFLTFSSNHRRASASNNHDSIPLIVSGVDVCDAMRYSTLPKTRECTFDTSTASWARCRRVSGPNDRRPAPSKSSACRAREALDLYPVSIRTSTSVSHTRCFCSHTREWWDGEGGREGE